VTKYRTICLIVLTFLKNHWRRRNFEGIEGSL
jgi:hypothetical protein